MEGLLAVHLSTKKNLRVANHLRLAGSYTAVLFLNVHVNKHHSKRTHIDTLIHTQTTDSSFFLLFFAVFSYMDNGWMASQTSFIKLLPI